MQFFTLALTAISAVAAQASVGNLTTTYGMGLITPSSVRPSAISTAPSSITPPASASISAVSTVTGNSTVTAIKTTTIYATRTVVISGVTTTVVVSTVATITGAATTMLVVPTTVVVSSTTQTVVVAIPVVGGSVINSNVASMTLPVTAAGAAKTTLPTVSTLPAAGSDATKLMAGSVAALVAIVALIA